MYHYSFLVLEILILTVVIISIYHIECNSIYIIVDFLFVVTALQYMHALRQTIQSK